MLETPILTEVENEEFDPEVQNDTDEMGDMEESAENVSSRPSSDNDEALNQQMLSRWCIDHTLTFIPSHFHMHISPILFASKCPHAFLIIYTPLSSSPPSIECIHQAKQ